MSAGFVKHSVSELRQLRTTPACWWLAFSSNELESAYQRWHAANFGSDLKGGLLLSCFFYFAASVSFAAWSRLSGVGATTATGGTVADAAIVIALPLAFACSFSSCAVKRPHAFAAMVLLCTVSFVVLRAMIFDAAAVFTAPSDLSIFLATIDFNNQEAREKDVLRHIRHGELGVAELTSELLRLVCVVHHMKRTIAHAELRH
eukprot:6208931-Pleurochrysis_carterae.AAC.2